MCLIIFLIMKSCSFHTILHGLSPTKFKSSLTLLWENKHLNPQLQKRKLVPTIITWAPLLSDPTKNVNSRKTQKRLFFVLSETRKEGIPPERACFCSVPNPVSRWKRPGEVEWSLALWSEWSAYLQRFHQQACFFYSVLNQFQEQKDVCCFRTGCSEGSLETE